MRVSTVNGGQSPSGDSSYGQWGPQILDASKKTGIPPELLYQQMMAESSGNPNSLGDGGKSFGLMQIQQATWEDFQKNNRDKLPPELKNASWDQIKNDPRLNLLAGAALMKGYHDEWAAKGYSSDDAWKLALRQYNSGSVPDPNNLSNAGGATAGYVDKIWGAYASAPGFKANNVIVPDDKDIT
ncbi:transglycosylase SLT domain-containing protein [Duganella hordei]|jgi:soluble lytic murein transglycosylase-like protein|uniref:transglycosylase SLT domain-containing protein n=1 Tax=Duganella hordei TaxID=2865934 RepID=UPI00159D7B44